MIQTKSNSWASGLEPFYGVIGISRLNDSFETGHIDARMMRQRAGGGDALADRPEPAAVLERIAGRDQPPDTIELEPLESEQAGAEMRQMRRVEGAAEQADLHAGRVRRQHALSAHG